MLRLIGATATFVAMSAAIAGPSEGDLFGYRLGSKYLLTEKTKGYYSVGGVVVIADKPDKPANFKRVELITTPKTYTIANIYGVAEVATEKQAKDIAAQYADLLQTLHGPKCKPEKAYFEEPLLLLCGGLYELRVQYFKPDRDQKEKHYKVHVGLKFANDTESGKKIIAQFFREMEQLDKEGRKRRLEQATKEQMLRGLQ